MDMERTSKGICIDGFKASGLKRGKYGLALIVSGEVCKSAGVFTRNSVKAAHVLLDGKKLESGIQAIVINSGNANCCVKNALQDAKKMCELAAKELGIDADNVAVASTGIIGKNLDLGIIEELTREAGKNLSEKGGRLAAEAIMTTDTFSKEISVEFNGIKVGGIAKGAGMINPDMATILCFLTTNANLGRKELQDALSKSVDSSFNMLSVDGDMSTNDTVLLLSNGKFDCSQGDFQAALDYATVELAKMIAKDGEGSEKFIEVEVSGAADSETARKGAKAVVSSNLVKSAVYGENPNWGRIVSALGSVIDVNFEKIDIEFQSEKGNVAVVKKGKVNDLKKAGEILKGKEIRILVNLGSGNGEATAFGCDLTPEYVKINAEYS